MSVSKLLSRIIAPTINKETASIAKQQEELILHDHTYGITSDPLTQFSVVLSALIHDGEYTHFDPRRAGRVSRFVSYKGSALRLH